MARRPQLRIATHGKIKRIYQGGGVWLARCRYRDTDGVTRLVQNLGPTDEYDKYGRLAEDALIAVLAERKRAAIHGEIGPDTKVADLVEQHLARLAEDGRSPVTMSTYRFTNTKLKKFVGGLRVSEATPARMDAAPSIYAQCSRSDDGSSVEVDSARCSAACGDGQRHQRQSGARRTACAVQEPAEGRRRTYRRPTA
jgi:hypothetical protein